MAQVSACAVGRVSGATLWGVKRTYISDQSVEKLAFPHLVILSAAKNLAFSIS
jgi:hypothetical protein